jgi:multisubunit Na+/H+ antiporter MnhC subunit
MMDCLVSALKITFIIVAFATYYVLRRESRIYKEYKESSQRK